MDLQLRAAFILHWRRGRAGGDWFCYDARMLSARTNPIAIAVLLLAAIVPLSATTAVTKLDISPKNAKVLNHIADYPDLEVLSISCLEDLKALPESIGRLTRLRELIIDNGNGCSMNPVLPESLGNLRSLEKLVLYGAQDPREPGHPSGVRRPFPRGMSQLTNLTYLDLGRNGLEEIPAFVRDLSRLKVLKFGWNMKVKEVPAFLADLHELTTLDLGADGLADLPDFLNAMPKLTRINLGYNCAITQSGAKMRRLKRRFPKITFDFTNEYDCPGGR